MQQQFSLGPVRVMESVFLCDDYIAEVLFKARIQNLSFRIKFPRSSIHVSIYLNIGNISVSNITIFLGKQCYNDELFEALYTFILEAENNGETVAIVCIESNVSAMGVILWFLMRRFGWVLQKCVDFMQFKIPDLQMKSQFMQLLSKIEKKIAINQTLKDFDWMNLSFFFKLAREDCDPQEILIKNTYYNSMQHISLPKEAIRNKNTTKHIIWTDNFSDDKQKLITLYIPPYSDIQFKNKQRPSSLIKKRNPEEVYKFQQTLDFKDIKTAPTKESLKVRPPPSFDRNSLKQKTSNILQQHETKVNNFFNNTYSNAKEDQKLPLMAMKKKSDLQAMQKNYLKIYSNNANPLVNKSVKKKKPVPDNKRPRTARSEQKDLQIIPVTGYTLKTQMFNNIQVTRATGNSKP